MVMCMVRYSVPIALRLPDEAFAFEREGHRAWIRCASAAGEALFSYARGMHDWICRSSGYESFVVTSINKLGAREVARTVRYPGGKTVFEGGGFIDPLTYTIMEVVVEVQESPVTDEAVSWLLDYGGQAADWFLSMYRLAFQDATAMNLTMRDSSVVEIRSADAPVGTDPMNLDFELIKVRFNWVDPFKSGRVKPPGSSESVGLLARLISSGRQLRLHERLLLDAKEQGHVHGACDLTVVLAETAFEVFSREALLRACRQRGTLTLPVGRGKGTVEKPFTDAIAAGQVRGDLLHRYVPMITGSSVTDSSEYAAWVRDAFKLRNEIVHEGRRNVSNDEAGAAFTAVVALISRMEHVLKT